MIANQAWGAEGEHPSLCLGHDNDASTFSDSEDMCIVNGQSETMVQKDDEAIFNHSMQGEVMDSSNMDEDMEGDEEGQEDNDSSGNSSDLSDCDMEVTWTRLSDAHPSLHSHTGPPLEDNHVSEGSLPELCIALDDPEGGHIEELLYWVCCSSRFWLIGFISLLIVASVCVCFCRTEWGFTILKVDLKFAWQLIMQLLLRLAALHR